MDTRQYLDAVKTKHGITSDYSLSKLLGVSKQCVSRYSNGITHFDDHVAKRVADLIGIHPGIVILDMHIERSKSSETRSIYEEISAGFPTPLLHANSVRTLRPAR